MQIAIIQFPGSNCETESLRAVRQAGMEAEEFLWNRNYADLANFDGYFIVGGFSYEDRSRSGIIASLDPLMPHIRAEAEKGKPVLGICNGAQILVETGLVPGLKNNAVGMALAENKRVKDGKVIGTGFYNAWTHIQLSVPSGSSAFSRHLDRGNYMRVPIAHGEGRFVIPVELLEEMKSKQLTTFRYCDEKGKISEDFPVNPNGAVYNLAAVTNTRGNVMAMMPHPERTDAGQPIFTSMRNYIAEHHSVILAQHNTVILNEPAGDVKNPSHQTTNTSTNAKGSFAAASASAQDDSKKPHHLMFTPPPLKLTPYSKPQNTLELITQLLITDNEAVTVQNTLQQLGLTVTIKRAVHWEIDLAQGADPNSIREALINSGELFNPNKEQLTRVLPSIPSSVEEGQSQPPPLLHKGEGGVRSRRLLVRYRDDSVGQYKQEQLGLPTVTGIKKGILWEVSGDRATIDSLTEKILATHILYNQFSQECFIYQIEPVAMGQSISVIPATSGNPTHTIIECDPGSPFATGMIERPVLPQFQPMSYEPIIKQNLNHCLTETNLPIGQKKVGKVRDSYILPDKVILITTDRQSAFDRVLAAIPFKGQVLNQTSAWWFNKTKHIVPNHVLAVPDSNVTVGKKCTVFPVEFVVRGYITGTTSTSAWVNYEKGMRDYCGNILPGGLKKNQKFDHPLVTPTTKSDEHDRLISPKEIVAEGLMTQADWDYVSAKTLELFMFGQKIATEHGLILVDTKYEFGKDADGNIMIVDEMHTPDSSRYWIAGSYAERFREGKEPENIDKEFLRLWFKDHCDPYNDVELPPAPEELVVELSRRYIQLYEMITGEKFVFPDENIPITKRIETALLNSTATSNQN